MLFTIRMLKETYVLYNTCHIFDKSLSFREKNKQERKKKNMIASYQYHNTVDQWHKCILQLTSTTSSIIRSCMMNTRKSFKVEEIFQRDAVRIMITIMVRFH
jgi:hypothetical protein